MYTLVRVCDVILGVCARVCVCVLCVHQLLGNRLLIPHEGVISDSQCVKSQSWQLPQHSVRVYVLCVCVCALSKISALDAWTKRISQFPFKVQMPHIHTFV